MPSKEILELVDKSNEGILNAIRADSSLDYQRRIPEATKANLAEIMQNLQDNRPLQNEFVNALVNRIGLTIGRNMIWQNPLSWAKIGMLTAGDTIEEYGMGLLEAHTYENDREAGERAIFGTEIPEVKAIFHKRNRQNYYKVTVNTAALNAAFLSPGGLNDFVTRLMQAPATSDQWDEFMLMCELFPEYEKNGGFHKVNVADVSALGSDGAASRDAIRKTQAITRSMQFPSTRYNAARMPTFANPDELVMFATPEYQAAIDVEALAGAFNPDKLATPRIVTIPEEQFAIPGAQAILTTKDFFVVADTLIQTEEARNPVKLHTNFFLHHHGIISASTFAPAVLFTSKPVQETIELVSPVTGVSAVTVTDRDNATVTEVKRGEIYNVSGKAETDGENSAVRFSLEGATAPGTYVTQEGVLHVGGTEGAGSLKIVATAVWVDLDGLSRDGLTNSTTVTVTGPAASAWPVKQEIPAAFAALSIGKPVDEVPAYGELTVDQLRAELKSRDLDAAGLKPELVERLAADDASKAPQGAPAE